MQDLKFKIRTIDATNANMVIEYINPEGVIETGTSTIEELTGTLEIPTKNFDSDGNRITREVPQPPINPNNNLFRTVPFPNVSGPVTKAQLTEQIRRYYPHEGFDEINSAVELDDDTEDFLGSTVETTDSVALVAERKKRTIELEREIAIFSPIDYDGNTFQADQRSIDLLTAKITSINAGNELPDDFKWRDINNVNHAADEDFLKELLGAIDTNAHAQYVESWRRKASLKTILDSNKPDSEKMTEIGEV